MPSAGIRMLPAPGYHLNEDCYPVRIVDDQYEPVPPGVSGRVIISNLINRATVLLNYELGDEGRILPGLCQCGRTQRMLSLNISRVADRLTLADGEQVHPIRFAEAVYWEKDLWQHQVVQKSENEFELFLVADPAADRDAMGKRLIDEFEKWFQGRIRVHMQFVDQIEMTPGRKTKSSRIKALRRMIPGRDGLRQFLIADCGLRIADCGLRIADWGLRIGGFAPDEQPRVERRSPDRHWN